MRNKRKRLRTRRQKVRQISFGTIIFTLVIGYVLTMLFWPVQAVQASIATYNNTNTQKADIVPTINWPTYGQSAIGTLDGNIISTAGDQTPVPIASITKVITALTVLKHK